MQKVRGGKLSAYRKLWSKCILPICCTLCFKDKQKQMKNPTSKFLLHATSQHKHARWFHTGAVHPSPNSDGFSPDCYLHPQQRAVSQYISWAEAITVLYVAANAQD